ncbi:hypothetical protein [Limnoglobus roseus]|uniref:Uncharacterized protein n=1 Tax=Limnoglobus roseus TaxID=2598579 RepID=A0A5C1AE59_9BACT|nr:hypothetical protein [Limnoglobus roseus]QEL17669.1 hypothetical protein PX52LOC_04667 [Limnoglobus roseus]
MPDDDFLKPAGLGPDGEQLWADLIANAELLGLTRLDRHAMKMACKYVDRFHAKADDPKGDIGMGISFDKLMLISGKLGLTPACRRALGLRPAKKKVERPKTVLDGMRPEDFGHVPYVPEVTAGRPRTALDGLKPSDLGHTG